MIRPQMDSETGDVIAHACVVGGGHDSVREGEGVRLLRRRAALRAARQDAVDVHPVGRRSVALTAAASSAARPCQSADPAESPATEASCDTRLNALTASTLLAVSAATVRS